MPEVTFDLPSGGSVTLRDGRSVRSGDKRHVTYAVADSGLVSGGEFVLARDLLAARLVSAWTLPYLPGAKIPRDDMSAFDELQSDDFEAIVGHPNVIEAATMLYGARDATPDDATVPGSPTGPVGDS